MCTTQAMLAHLGVVFSKNRVKRRAAVDRADPLGARELVAEGFLLRLDKLTHTPVALSKKKMTRADGHELPCSGQGDTTEKTARAWRLEVSSVNGVHWLVVLDVVNDKLRRHVPADEVAQLIPFFVL